MRKVKLNKRGILAICIAAIVAVGCTRIDDVPEEKETAVETTNVVTDEAERLSYTFSNDYVYDLSYREEKYDKYSYILDNPETFMHLDDYGLTAWEVFPREDLKLCYGCWTSDLYGSNEITNVDANTLNLLIRAICKKRGLDVDENILIDTGATLVECEEAYGVSAVCCLSIWTWESGFGDSNLAKTKNNLGGITGKDGKYKKFDTVEEGMLYQAELLRNNYIDKGYVTYSEIGSKYCPYDSKWGENVANTAKNYAKLLEGMIG